MFNSESPGFSLPLSHLPPLGWCQDLQVCCPVISLSSTNKIVLEFPSELFLNRLKDESKNAEQGPPFSW